MWRNRQDRISLMTIDKGRPAGRHCVLVVLVRPPATTTTNNGGGGGGGGSGDGAKHIMLQTQSSNPSGGTMPLYAVVYAIKLNNEIHTRISRGWPAFRHVAKSPLFN